MNLKYFSMPLTKHRFDSLVEKHLLAVQKVWGSILRQGRIFFVKSDANIHKFLYRIQQVKHESKTQVFWTLATRDIVYWVYITCWISVVTGSVRSAHTGPTTQQLCRCCAYSMVHSRHVSLFKTTCILCMFDIVWKIYY